MNNPLLSHEVDYHIPSVRTFNPRAVHSPHITEKQASLNTFSDLMHQDTASSFHLLKQGLSGMQNHGTPDQRNVLGLFANKSNSFWNRKCTESGSLALVAMALKIFGNKILDASGKNIDRHKLEMALHMLFGKDMPSIKSDVMSAIANMRLEASEHGYTIRSKNYVINVGRSEDSGGIIMDDFVNSQNVDRSYFQKIGARDAQNFFENESVPDFLWKCLNKTHETPTKISSNNPKPAIEEMSSKMESGKKMHTRETTTINSWGTTKDNLSCEFLADSAPSQIHKHVDKIREQEVELWPPEKLTERPVNVYRANFERQTEDGPTTKSHITCCGSQYGGTESENIEKAQKIIQAVKAKNDPDTLQKKLIVVDLRLLAENKIKGNEQGIYRRHVSAMEAACESEGVDYRPIFHEAHTLGEGRVTRLQHSPLTTPSAKDEESGSLKDTVCKLFGSLPTTVWRKHAAVYEKWAALYDKRHDQHNAIAFATLSKILFEAISENSDTHIELLMGCKSAKDRTTSVLAGITLLEPLILRELEHPSGRDGAIDIQRFFTESGHFNYEGLTPDEKVYLKDLYDLSLLQASNKFNTGAETNVSSAVLKEFFEGVDFIAESEPHTVSAHG